MRGPQASLVRTDDGNGPSYLVYPNFKVLMAWNRSTYFALTVGQLAESGNAKVVSFAQLYIGG